MTRQVDTRNGLFANEGWGGGVFNYNVSFGSVENPSGVGLGQDELFGEEDLSIIIFATAVHFLYPDLEARFIDEMDKRVEQEGEEAAGDRLFGCIDKNFPEGVLEVPPLPDEGPSPEDLAVLGQIFPKDKVQQTLDCLEGKTGNLGIILPAVAGVALILWLFARK
jgi:hypothetical protein